MAQSESELVIFDRQTREEQSYWLARLSPEMEVSAVRPDYLTAAGSLRQPDVVEAALPGRVYEKLVALTRGGPFLIYATLMAALKASLHKNTGSRRITVASPARRLGTDVPQQSNLLAIADEIDDRETFHKLLMDVRQTLLDAYARQQYPFHRLIKDLGVKEGDGCGSLFSVGLAFGEIHLDWPSVNLDISINFERTPGQITARVVYDAGLYRRETVERFMGQYVNLLGEAVENPALSIGQLRLLSEAERHQILVEWNDVEGADSESDFAHELVEAQAAARPEAIALACGDEQITSRELSRRSNQLARHLRGLGVGPETRVGLCLDRSVDLVVAQLAVLKAGGAFLPLDATLPPDRLYYMVEDSQSLVLITQERLLDRLPSHWGTVLILDSEWEQVKQESDAAIINRAEQRNLAYVIYTSGSTGRPKGVEVEHSALTNLIRWHQRAFQVGPEDRATQVAGLGFDASVWEVWPYLAGGASLSLVDEANRATPGRLMEWIAERAVTICFLPTPWMEIVMEGQWPRGLSLRKALTGGDRLQRGPRPGMPFELVNNYGPTEGAVVSTWGVVEAEEERSVRPAIGRPIDNGRVYLLDESGEPVPLAAVGELHVGGEGLARGYLNGADLTAEKFIPDPFSQKPGSRLYRTGDLASFRPDGQVEFLGRRDHQVKVRGYRIELGEIEAALAHHPGVQEAVVVAREDQSGNNRLVAYLVVKQDGPPNHSGWLRYLKDKLPDYMLPSAFVVMESLPLTPNGKIDRRALPVPEQQRPELEQAFAEPRTPAEQILAEVWAEVLAVERVGIHDNYFELGGDSIRSIQIAAKAEQRGVSVSLHQLFKTPTIAELAKAVGPVQPESLSARQIDPFGLISQEDRARIPDGVEDAYPLAHIQAGMLFHSEYSPETSVYHNVLSYHLRARFDEEAMRAAIDKLIGRHAVLRTSFDLTNFSEPLQLVHREVDSPLQVKDLRRMESDEQDRFLYGEFEEEKRRPFNWSRAPLLRLKIYRRGDERFQLMLVFHHAILDGWSDSTMLTELFSHYWYLLGEAASDIGPAPKAGFRDYVALEREEIASAEGQQYWQEMLSNLTVTRAPRWKRSEPSSQPRRVQGRTALISEGVTDGLNALSRSAGVPIKSVLLAAHLRTLSLLSGQQDVVTGYVLNGRPEGSDGERMLGVFLNTLPFRQQVTGGSWEELVRQVYEAEREMLPHRRFPLAKLQQMMGGQELFEAAFNFTHFHVVQRLNEFEGKMTALETQGAGETNFALLVNFSIEPLNSQLILNLFFDDREFCGEEIELMMSYYLGALEVMARDPGGLYELSRAISDEEQHRLLVEWNDTRQPRERPYCLHHLFEDQAERTPDAVAIQFAQEHITYRGLNSRANDLAIRLQSLGVGPEVRVGICLDRSIEMVVALLGILKAGGAYVPLDPAYPSERLLYMLEDAQVSVLIAAREFKTGLSGHGANVIYMDAKREWVAQGSECNPRSGVVAQNLAYVIYTSGSTGRPKGVAIEHRSAVALVDWGSHIYGPDDLAGVLASTSLCFDLSVFELLMPLSCGGKVVVVENALALGGLEAGWGVSLINTVPSAAAELVRACSLPGSVQTVNLAGEPLAGKLVEQIYREKSVRQVFNLYGPSEDTTYSTYALVDRQSQEAPSIGRPAADTEVYLLNRALEPVPVAVTAELHIGGAGLARGYLNRPALTAEMFIANPFGPEPGARLYRTGDLARFRPDGQIDFIGRVDHQVKLRGYRIEIGEIEAVLGQHPAVKEAAVVAREDDPGERRLVAYVVSGQGMDLTVTGLRSYLSERLPAYMVPAAFEMMERLPLTANGKIDRRALPAPGQRRADRASSYEAPRTPVEELIADIWAQVLGVEKVGIHDDFLDLGGQSLLATQVMSRVRQTFQVEVPLRRLFEWPTVAGLAACIERARREGQSQAVPPIEPASRSGELPLSFAQQRLWFLDRLESSSPFYNVSTAARLSGPLNLTAFEQTLGEIVRRHEVLRTAFPAVDGRPIQFIAEAQRLSIPTVDLSNLPGAVREAEMRRLAGIYARRPFDLAQGPLLRVVVLSSGDRDHVVLFTMHHIVTDGWSSGVMIREVTAFYRAFVNGGPSPLSELPIQYADFAVWQRQWLRGEVLDLQLSYWKRYLSGALPVLELPTDRPRPAMQSYRGATHAFALPTRLTESLRALSRREGATVFMTLLAAFKTLLYCYTGKDDIIVGTDIANRTRGEIEGLIGFFVNQLVLRTDLSEAPTFRELLGQVRERTLGAYAHQDLPFDLLVRELQPERDLSRTPLFQAKFIFLDVSAEEVELPRLTLTPLALDSETTPYEFVLSMTQAAGGLAGTVIYSTDLFDGETVARMLSHFMNLLESVVADPQQRLSSLHLLSEDEVGGFSVLDFPDADLSQRDFESLFMQFGKQRSLG